MRQTATAVRQAGRSAVAHPALLARAIVLARTLDRTAAGRQAKVAPGDGDRVLQTAVRPPGSLSFSWPAPPPGPARCRPRCSHSSLPSFSAPPPLRRPRPTPPSAPPGQGSRATRAACMRRVTRSRGVSRRVAARVCRRRAHRRPGAAPTAAPTGITVSGRPSTAPRGPRCRRCARRPRRRDRLRRRRQRPRRTGRRDGPRRRAVPGQRPARGQRPRRAGRQRRPDRRRPGALRRHGRPPLLRPHQRRRARLRRPHRRRRLRRRVDRREHRLGRRRLGTPEQHRHGLDELARPPREHPQPGGFTTSGVGIATGTPRPAPAAAPTRTTSAAERRGGGQPPIADIVRAGWTKPGSLTRCLSSLRQTASRTTCSSSSSVGAGAQRRAQVGLAQREQAGAQAARRR